MLVGIMTLAGALLSTRPAARLLAHRFGCSRPVAAGLVVATGSALAGILWSDPPSTAPFVVPDKYYFVSQLTSLRQWWAAASTIGGSGRELAIIALFIPAGLFAHLVFRQPALTVPAGMLLCLVVEAMQTVSGATGDLNDALNGTIGIAVGALLATAIELARTVQQSKNKPDSGSEVVD